MSDQPPDLVAEVTRMADHGETPGRRAVLLAAAAQLQAQAARIDKGLDFENRTSCGHVWTMRNTACPECFVALKAQLQAQAALLDSIRKMFVPTPDDRLVAAIERAWCARVNEEGLRQEVDCLKAERQAQQRTCRNCGATELDYCMACRDHAETVALDERDHLKAEVERLMRERPRNGDWWCPTCRVALDWSRVTHDERCDTCGTPVTVAGESLEAEIERLTVEKLEQQARAINAEQAIRQAEAALRTAMAITAQDDARLLAASEKVGEPPFGCDTADHLADVVLELRAALRERESSAK